MLGKALLPCAAVCCMLAVSCGPSLLHARNRSAAEAELLKAEVTAAGITGENIAEADLYLEKAKEGTKMSHVQYADYAAAIYSAALADRSLEASAKTLEAAAAAMRDSEERVNKYQQILAEISSGKEAN